ncbi:hypothetical protein FHX34_106137 [Actinoplanes teichomyceticus]|uniref:Uncharacterized protein n=2 Tax=Actinoplanes teichomyceticus TaxID=1867 RepID=A0A561VIJ5_ACTTI|nr:hypothetical protein FHX34_106137 [Actinoplanes teichomyceticus]GIF15781.1 hypothetical protein Ate01nite_58130 [Actinoplanes teichomyceticus]
MGRSWSYVAGWLAVTITAVAVSWFGVQLGIAPAITDEPPVAIDVNRRYTEIRFGLAESATPSPAASRPATRRSSKVRPSRTTASPAPRRTASRRPSATVSSSTSPSPSPTADQRPRYRINADGGTITVAYSATRVDVVGTDPLPGYAVSAVRRSDTIVVARLSGPGHTSAITAYWNGGPAAQVIEEYGS